MYNSRLEICYLMFSKTEKKKYLHGNVVRIFIFYHFYKEMKKRFGW